LTLRVLCCNENPTIEANTTSGDSAVKEKIQKSIQNYDELVVTFRYVDSKGNGSQRVVSPIRWIGNGKFLGLCLSREEPRQFLMKRCQQLELKPAWDYVMPVPMA
jgi:predicted DNA-binding transcriptional regulator YafY